MTNEIVYIPNYNEKFIKGIIRIRLKNKSDHKVINEINNHCRLTKYIPTKEYNLRETKLSEIYLRKHYRTSYTENYCNFKYSNYFECFLLKAQFLILLIDVYVF
jgi:hypothetical protein